MSTKVIITQKRPSSDVSFYRWSNDVLFHIKENYVDTGKIIAPIENNVSSDELTKTTLIRYSSDQSRIEYRDDPIVEIARAEMEEYNAISGITREIHRLD